MTLWQVSYASLTVARTQRRRRSREREKADGANWKTLHGVQLDVYLIFLNCTKAGCGCVCCGCVLGCLLVCVLLCVLVCVLVCTSMSSTSNGLTGAPQNLTHWRTQQIQCKYKQISWGLLREKGGGQLLLLFAGCKKPQISRNFQLPSANTHPDIHM